MHRAQPLEGRVTKTNPIERTHTMLLKTILNHVAPQKSFVYGKVTLIWKGK